MAITRYAARQPSSQRRLRSILRIAKPDIQYGPAFAGVTAMRWRADQSERIP